MSHVMESKNGSFRCDRSNLETMIGSGGFADIFRGDYRIKTCDNSKSDDRWIPVAIKFLNATHLMPRSSSTDSKGNVDETGIDEVVEDVTISFDQKSTLTNAGTTPEQELLHEIKMMQLLQGHVSILELLDVYLPELSINTNMSTSNTDKSKVIKPSGPRKVTKQSTMSASPLDLPNCCLIMEMASASLSQILYNSPSVPIPRLVHPQIPVESSTADCMRLARQQTLFMLKLKICWMIQCFEGLDHMSSKSVVHHDIKPDNLFYFPPSSTPASISTSTSTHTSSGDNIGTVKLSKLDSAAMSLIVGRMKIADFGLSHCHEPRSLCGAVKPQVAAWHRNVEQQVILKESQSKLRRSRESQAEQRRKQHQLDKQAKLQSVTKDNKARVSVNSDSDSDSESGEDDDDDNKAKITTISKESKGNPSTRSRIHLISKSTSQTAGTTAGPTIHDPQVVCKGHPVYHAPELLHYPPKCASASDVYALTVVLNEALTESKPIEEHPNSTVIVSTDPSSHPTDASSSHAGPHQSTTSEFNRCAVGTTATTIPPAASSRVDGAALAAVLHVAGSVPVQICSGIRPRIFDGQVVLSSLSPVTDTLHTVDTQSQSQSQLHSRPSGVFTLPEHITKRFQHLIRTGWANKASERPLAKGMTTSLRKVLEMIEVYEEESM